MIEIKVIKMADVSEDLSELSSLRSAGWKLQDRSSVNGELSVFATREVSLCQFFGV